jgi:hypothetical protein
MQDNVAWSVISGTLAAIGAWIWWRSGRGKRRKALRELGAKSKARLAALVRKAREAGVPRPALRPVPQGAPS